MKFLLRNIGINGFSLFALSQILDGVKITGGLFTILIGGLTLTILTMLLRPILNLISIPLNIVTFGAFQFVINAIILYVLTILISQITVNAFTFKGFSFLGFVVPKIPLNTFFAFLVSAFLLSFIISFISWLTKN